MTKKFSPSEVEAIFHKAASLDLQLKEALSLEQLKEIAFESGISLEALELAIEEVKAQKCLDSKPNIKSHRNFINRYSTIQKLSSHNHNYDLVGYTIGVFLAGRLGILILQYIYNAISELASGQLIFHKIFLGIIFQILELNLNLIATFAALVFPLALAHRSLKTLNSLLKT